MGEGNVDLLESIKTIQKNITISSEAVMTAHTTLNDHYTAFLAVAGQLEDKLKEVQLKEDEIERKKKEVEDQLHQREKMCSEHEDKVEVRDKEVTAKEEKLQETERKIQVTIEEFKTALGHHVSGIFFGESSVKSEAVAPGCTAALTPPSPAPPAVPPPPTISPVATLPTISPQLNANTILLSHKDSFQKWLPSRTFRLLYQASNDGFEASKFHALCDNKGPTLTIIRSTGGCLFGGFTPLSWDSNSGHMGCEEAFIFTLINPYNIPPTKYPIYNIRFAIYCHAEYGPTFGQGHDIYIRSNSHATLNFIHFPTSYDDTTGKEDNTFTGARTFKTSEIEVFSVL